MKMVKTVFVFLFAFAFLLSVSPYVSASGIGASLEDATRESAYASDVRMSGATSVYSYEINIDYANLSISSIEQADFLGANSTTTYGYTTRNNILTVYGSQTNNSRPGVSGSGLLFTVAYTPDHAATPYLSLRYILVVYSNDTTEYVYYNNSGASINAGSSGSSSSGTSSGTGTGSGSSSSGGGGSTNSGNTSVAPEAPEKNPRFTTDNSSVGQLLGATGLGNIGYYLLILIPVAIAVVGFIIYLIVRRLRNR